MALIAISVANYFSSSGRFIYKPVFQKLMEVAIFKITSIISDYTVILDQVHKAKRLLAKVVS